MSREEILRRRTFAIISHPDAGKTTITEAILLNGGVIRQAGQVKGKAGTKAATSDWMAMERERGVSITSSVMNFDHRGLRINLLDTPGHKDFGEDTYRTLHAADSAAMLIDAAKGVEVQTRKLYEVCRLRKMPIFTFANKMDRDGKEPLELIDDVESTLSMKCFPVTWPIGMGDRFKALYHRLENKVYFYEKGRPEIRTLSVSSYLDEQIREAVGEELFTRFCEDLDLLEGAMGPFDREAFLKGELSPMTFGSAKHNWGVDIFLNLFCAEAPSPGPRKTKSNSIVNPLDAFFSGFIFKIQANMDPKHRDRVTFIRVCSGKFERGMKIWHPRLERELRLNYANQFMARERETVDEGFAGDIIGVIDTGYFQIGDSIATVKNVEFESLPRFSPECFARLFIKDPLKRRQMLKALKQLSEEGAVQIFVDPLVGEQDPVVAVVGELQFDVLLYRLNDEYGLEVRLERQPLSVARWVFKPGGEVGAAIQGGSKLYRDSEGRPVVLLEKEWDLNWLKKENPGLEFHFTGAV